MVNVLYFSISTLLSICAVSSMVVGCSFWTSPFPGMLLKCFMMISRWCLLPHLTHIIITFVFTSHNRCSSSGKESVFLNLLHFLFDHISVFSNCNTYWHACVFLITYYYYYYYRTPSPHLLSQDSPPRYFSWTNSDLHRSGFKFQTAVPPLLCVMFQVRVQPSSVVILLNAFLLWHPHFSLYLLLIFRWLQ